MRSREISYKERQLLPLYVWLRRLFPSNKASPVSAHDLLSNNSLFVNLLSAAPSCAHHKQLLSDCSGARSIPALAHVTAGLTHSEVDEILASGHSSCNFPVHQRYARVVPRHNPHHLRDHLALEVSLCEHAAFVWGQCQPCNPDAVVDFGGGNGILSILMQDRLQSPRTIVVDEDLPPIRVDNDDPETNVPALATQLSGVLITKEERDRKGFRRVQSSISQVKFCQALQLDDPSKVIAVSKHLCGGGIDDLLLGFARQDFFPRALCLSSCCHFKRLSGSYCNPSFLADFKISHEDTKPWVFDIVDRETDATAMQRLLEVATPPRSAHYSPQLLALQDFLLPLTFERSAELRLGERHVQAQRQDAERKSRYRIARLVARTFEAAVSASLHRENNNISNNNVRETETFTRSRQRDPLRSLLEAVASRTNWVSGHHIPGIASLGSDIECVLDAGRVDFLLRTGRYSNVTIVPCVPVSCTPRNKVLLAW